MVRSFPAVIALGIVLLLGGCSLFRKGPAKPALPAATVRTATMDVTPGIKVLSSLRLPPGFVPLPGRAPMWLQEGTELVIVGARDGRTEIYGYSGPGWKTERLIAADGGPGAKNGVIVDVAASQNGMSLAYAVYNAKEKRLYVVVRDLIATGGGHPVADFDGDFASASVGWLNPVTITLALRDKPAPAVPPPSPTVSQDKSHAPSKPGLYVIGINGIVTAELETVKCPLSSLVWGPHSFYAVGQGDAGAPPIVLDRHGPSCRQIFASGPIRVLDWSPDGNSFLYAQRGADGVETTYRYWIARHTATLAVLSSEAAAFTAAGEVLALGNSSLTFQQASRFPNRPLRAELALAHAKGGLDVVSLGFNTTPALLAQSAMTYSLKSNRAAMDTFLPTTSGVFRRIISYSVATQSAFVIAYGAALGPVEMSWSPLGQYLALVDGVGAQSVLTIVEPSG